MAAYSSQLVLLNIAYSFSLTILVYVVRVAVGCQKRLIFCDTTQLAAAQTPPDAAVWHHTSVLSHELGIVEQASICSLRFAYSKYGVSSMLAKVRFYYITAKLF